MIDSRIMSYESRFVATNHLAWYYYVSKDTSNLNPLLQDYIALNPGDWRAYPLLASSLIEFGDLKDARIDSLYECWIALEPDSNRAKNYYASHCINLAKRLVQEGRLDEAIARNKKAIRLNPKLAVAHNNLGVAYYAAKDYEEAIRCYQQAIELDSSYAQAYVNLGNVYDEIRDSDRAIALYQKALEIEPSNSLAYENMGSAYYRQGARLKAIESMQKAARLGALDAQHFLRAMGETW
ncbi:MAG: hypothetical protein AUI33_17140 [Ignavibacteria bacterium 13_1_40CM_2_61_4]|nr:MAG: hypothetical protein AUI33_17140 [Ignavibacteria bacterium 13_1_40CM_2_61_4]